MSKLALYIDQGVSRCRYYGNDIIDTNMQQNPKYAFTGGLGVQYKLNSQYGLSAGFFYERRGSVTEGIIFNRETKSQILDEYIILPILVRYSFGKRFNYYVEGGAWGGYLVAQKSVLDIDTFHIEEYVNHLNKFKRKNYGIIVGIGVSYAHHKHWQFSLSLRQNAGIRNMLNYTSKTQSLRSYTTSLLLGVSYQLKKRHINRHYKVIL